MKTIRAKLGAEISNAVNYSGKKELIAGYSVVAATKRGLAEVVCARAWMGRSAASSVVYASLWVYTKDRQGKGWSGHGSAGGYGYNKESAAFDEAIRSAGIELSQTIGGGESAMIAAFEAIARACGYSGRLLVVSH